MGKYSFERECRTPYSECYTVLGDSAPVGRVDIHYAEEAIHATLSIVESLTSDNVQELVDTIGDQLVDSVGIAKHEMIVHVHQGRDIGVFSSHDFDGNGGYEHMS